MGVGGGIEDVDGTTVNVVVRVVVTGYSPDPVASFCSNPIEIPSNMLVNNNKIRTRTNKTRVRGVNGSVVTSSRRPQSITEDEMTCILPLAIWFKRESACPLFSLFSNKGVSEAEE